MPNKNHCEEGDKIPRSELNDTMEWTRLQKPFSLTESMQPVKEVSVKGESISVQW